MTVSIATVKFYQSHRNYYFSFDMSCVLNYGKLRRKINHIRTNEIRAEEIGTCCNACDRYRRHAQYDGLCGDGRHAINSKDSKRVSKMCRCVKIWNDAGRCAATTRRAEFWFVVRHNQPKTAPQVHHIVITSFPRTVCNISVQWRASHQYQFLTGTGKSLSDKSVKVSVRKAQARFLSRLGCLNFF